MAAGLAPVTAALIHNYAEKQALSEHIKQYDSSILTVRTQPGLPVKYALIFGDKQFIHV